MSQAPNTAGDSHITASLFTPYLVTLSATYTLGREGPAAQIGRILRELSPSRGPVSVPTAGLGVVPITACVAACYDETLQSASCPDMACFCANLSLAIGLRDCVSAACPASDQSQAIVYYSIACAMLDNPFATLLQDQTGTQSASSSPTASATTEKSIAKPTTVSLETSKPPNTSRLDPITLVSHSSSAYHEAASASTPVRSTTTTTPLLPASAQEVPISPFSWTFSLTGVTPTATTDTMSPEAPRPGYSIPIPTRVLAGVVTSAVLSVLAAILLFRLWFRRRRAHMHGDPPRQAQRTSPGHYHEASHTSVSSSYESLMTLVDDRALESHAHSSSSLSDSAQAQDGSAATLQSYTSSSTHTPSISGHSEKSGHHEHASVGPSPLPGPSSGDPRDRSRDRPCLMDAIPRDFDMTAEADARGERLLHLALPWSFGQRVLATMGGTSPRRANEEAHSVDSRGSDPPPAYEPHA